MKKHSRSNKKNSIYIAIFSSALVLCAVGSIGNKGKIQNGTNFSETPQSSDLSSANSNQFIKENFSVEEKEDNITITPKETKENLEVPTSTKAEVTEPTFTMPCNGKVLVEFSNNKLILNENLNDYRTHNGIDIEAKEGAEVFSSSDGKIADITNNSMGYSIIIDHNCGYRTVYSNLSDKCEVKKGDEVTEGKLIGYVKNTAVSDFCEQPHLHFEVLQNGKYVNPLDKIKQ